MAGAPSGLPQPPREEGVFGPGARKFIGWLVTIAVVVGVIVLALNIDFGDLGDELDSIDEPTTEEPKGEGGRGEGSDAAAEKRAEEAAPAEPDVEPQPLNAAGIAAAIDALRDEVGGNPHMVRLRSSPESIELVIRDGEQPVGYSWVDGELTELPAVVVAGSGPLAKRDFLASTVDPKSLGRLLLGAKRESKGRKLEVVNATLEAEVLDPDRLRWLLNAEAPNGSAIAFRAKRDGSGVEQLGSTGPPGAGLPPQAREQLRDAQRIADCIQEAGDDTDAILDCTGTATP
jgi:hypothetical protein